MKRRAPAPLPLATLALTAAIVALYGFELARDGLALCAMFGFVPEHPSVASAVASLFLHDPANFMHVGGNLLVLAIVGGQVERAIGSLRFAALFFAGGLAGAALHSLVGPSSLVPLVGASASLFAVLAVAAVVCGPAMLAFVAVLALQSVGQAFGMLDAGAVSFAAHIGGFACGAAVVILARLRWSICVAWPRAVMQARL